MLNKPSLLKTAAAIHRLIAWVAALALLIFALSAITHPLMTWTGPKQTAFFPPQTTIDANAAANIPSILKQYGITEVLLVKVIPSGQGDLLQVTQVADQPRRYFDLRSGDELIDYDMQHAIWLARYYTGASSEVARISFQNRFDNHYPWVNRLLPVYKVEFDQADGLSAFIYTETNALASISNHYKNNMQAIFRTLHTFSWLEGMENARVILMSFLLCSLLLLICAGIGLLFLLKRRKNMSRSRLCHRIIGHVLWIPLLGLTASGLYHLLQYTDNDSPRGLQLGQPFSLQALPEQFALRDALHTLNLNHLTLLAGPDQQLTFRLSVPSGKPGAMIEHHHRFDGQATEKQAVYVSAQSGKRVSLTDQQMARHFAIQHSGLTADQLTGAQLITHFGPGYDFRNKRLPVWKFDTPHGSIFIDPGTGLLVDQSSHADQLEGLSFSMLHKWNFLVPLTGRGARDALVIVTLVLILLLLVIGLLLRIKR